MTADGREYDWQTGVYYYRARAYSPDLGRFLQQDPAGMVDGPNLYAYVGNNPINRVDPTGMRIFRVYYSVWGFRSFTSAFYQHMSNCMMEKVSASITVGAISILLALCIGGIAVLTLLGVVACATGAVAKGVTFEAARAFIDCALTTYTPAEKDVGIKWSTFHWYETPTGYKGWVPT